LSWTLYGTCVCHLPRLCLLSVFLSCFCLVFVFCLWVIGFKGRLRLDIVNEDLAQHPVFLPSEHRMQDQGQHQQDQEIETGQNDVTCASSSSTSAETLTLSSETPTLSSETPSVFHIVDAGGGIGQFSSQLAARYMAESGARAPHVRVTLCDISSEMLDMGRQEFAQHCPQCRTEFLHCSVPSRTTTTTTTTTTPVPYYYYYYYYYYSRPVPPRMYVCPLTIHIEIYMTYTNETRHMYCRPK
jgi:hypothetical protein